MKKILILADGKVAERFIERINQKRIGDNHYIVVGSGELKLPQKVLVTLESVTMDPTSYSKIRNLFRSHDFTMVFILLDTLEETGESLKNIRRVDEKIYVVLLDRWNGFSKLRQSSTHVIDSLDMLANRIYDFLPGVPVVAKSIGLGEGEIMEVLIPFGSTFAYRHVGSIAQVKWKIAAIYRNRKLILPTNATMIRPQDTLLIVGKPQVLDNIFKRIHNREGMFPEPFGRNLYLYLDMQNDEERAVDYLKEASYLCERLEERKLYVRIFNPGDFEILNTIRDMQNHFIDVEIVYDEPNGREILNESIHETDAGLVFISQSSLSEEIFEELYDNNKLVYLFGEEPLYEIERSVILMMGEEEMEALSSTSFYISETLELELCLCNFDPDGDFKSKKRIVEHYETLSHIFHYPVKIEERRVNPLRAVREMKHILQISPMSRKMKKRSLFSIFSMKIEDHLLDYDSHPKLFIPIESG